jgi:ribosomal protein S18
VKFKEMKSIKHLVGVMAIVFLTSTMIYAQPQGGQSDKVEALKVSFITQELSLTPDEAKVFWPVFNQFEDERKTLRRNFKPNGPGESSVASMSDAEATSFINNQLDFEQKNLDITKRYISEFKRILPIKKVALLMTVENKFKRMILERYKGHQGGQK